MASEAMAGGRPHREIERRFLCRIRDRDALRSIEAKPILQAYMPCEEPAVRVRRIGDQHLLTVKSGSGRVRREVEVPVPADAAATLFEIAGDRTIEKLRYESGGWEIDVFGGKLAGLLVAEAELDDADAPLPATPAWLELAREVTDEPGLTNHALAGLGAAEAWELVARLMRE